MEEKGFLNRESYKIKFTDISEFLIASMLVTKINNEYYSSIIDLQFSLLDFFPQFLTMEKLEIELNGKNALIKDRNTEYFADTINFLFKTNIGSHESEVDLLKFYNDYIERRFYFLLNGDTCGQKPCLEEFNVDKNSALYIFKIKLIPSKFIKIHAENLFQATTLQEEMYIKLQGKVDLIGTAISYRKYLEFTLEYLNERQSRTGEKCFEFDLREIRFRHLVSTSEDNGERLTLPLPLTLGESERILMPFFMESIGLLDINGFKIGSSPLYIDDIELLYSITKPAIKNKYFAESFGLNPIKRKSLSETQIEIYERIYKQLSESACFLGRPIIEMNFCEVFYWLLKKVTFCLEEPSFLKEKAEKWLNENLGQKYIQMEDDFFLPFLHERLKNEFGELISKKPEKFGGEVDLLFADIPIELKVRKNQEESLFDIINEKYKPIGQAATYAAVTRLGFVLVLDLPNQEKTITNLDNCVKIIEKEFDVDSFKTQIVICIFYCNLPKPSSAK